MFKKQILHIDDEPIDDNTIKMLKKGDRYKLFKINIELDTTDQKRLKIFYEILDEMPDIEIIRIVIRNSNNEFLKTLAEKTRFKAKKDLFEALQIEDCL